MAEKASNLIDSRALSSGPSLAFSGYAVVVLIGLLVCFWTGVDKEPLAESEACSAMNAYTVDFKTDPVGQRPLVVSVTPMGWKHDLTAKRVHDADWTTDRPPRDLLERMFEAPETKPDLACPDYPALLGAEQIEFGEAAALENSRSGDQHDVFRARSLRLTLPVVSRGGQEAVMAASTAYGPLAGGTEIVHRGKNRVGRWVVTDELPIAIS